jgi:hypothetical protein
MNSVEGHLMESAHKLDTFLPQDTYAYSAPEVCGVKNKPTMVADTYALVILCTTPPHTHTHDPARTHARTHD